MKEYQIRCRENGDRIMEFDTMEEAEKVLEQYARTDLLEDMEDGETKPDWSRLDEYAHFYEIVEIDAE